MTIWFHRYRRMKLKMRAMTELNQAMCEANIELTEKLEQAETQIKALRAIHNLDMEMREKLKSDYNQLMCQFREITS
jgi:predicted nuclease with TOPRIM domain